MTEMMATNKYECIDIADDDDGEMDEPFENLHESKMIISRAVGDYTGDESSLGFYEGGSRRHQLYWTVDATKALIKMRCEREAEFSNSAIRKNRLWEEIADSMRELGYDFSVEKVAKKWHNIMITYNKNTQKKLRTGKINWEFYDDIDFYYKDRRPSYDDTHTDSNSPGPMQSEYQPELPPLEQKLPEITIKRRNTCLLPNGAADYNNQSVELSNFYNFKKFGGDVQNSTINNHHNDTTEDGDEHDDKRMRFNLDTEFPPMASEELETMWWKDYFEKRLELDRERMKRQQDRHREMMSMQKAALMIQEKTEKAKVDAINNLTNAINRMVDAKRYH